jgi:peptide chain release factor subunit 1
MGSATATQTQLSTLLSRADLEALTQRQAKPDSPVLSVYLDTDQSREINLERGFEVVLKDMLREIRQKLDKESRAQFDADATPVSKFVEDYRNVRGGLVLFCNASDNFFWVRELNIRVRNRARWNDTPYVRPLIEMVDEYERYAVVLTDRETARFFSIFLGEIEEHFQSEAPLEVTRVNEVGTDHIESHTTVQHKADEHAHLHLKQVAELTARLSRVREFDRLILAGTVEATSELSALLPKSVPAMVS